MVKAPKIFLLDLPFSLYGNWQAFHEMLHFSGRILKPTLHCTVLMQCECSQQKVTLPPVIGSVSLARKEVQGGEGGRKSTHMKGGGEAISHRAHNGF
jgi:hypothetical protein